jgi:pyruvate,orthophosphate dikinase
LERLNKSASSWPWNGKRAVECRRQLKITPAMAQEMSGLYRQLVELRDKLEAHYREVQDFEFTIERGRPCFVASTMKQSIVRKRRTPFPHLRQSVALRRQHFSSAALLCASR